MPDLALRPVGGGKEDAGPIGHGIDVSAPQQRISIHIKTRRKRYLEAHPEYFSSDLELADPLLYDRLVRRFQSTAEREAEGKKKGYSGILEADLSRGEAKLAALHKPEASTLFSYREGPNGEILAEEKDEVPASKEDGMARWKWEMEVRFIRGDDSDFDYPSVDDNEEYDDHEFENRQAEEKYFDEEEPEFLDSADSLERTPNGQLQGETGILDY